MRWMSARRTGCGGAWADGRRVRCGGRWPAAAVAGITVVAVLIGTVAPALAAGRVALVGNSAYTWTSLVTPMKDASDMASALRGLGFDVVLSLNADEDAMDDALGGVRGTQRRGQRRAGVLREPRPGDGRRELLGAGGRAPGERHRCSVRDRNGGGCSRVDGGCGASSRVRPGNPFVRSMLRAAGPANSRSGRPGPMWRPVPAPADGELLMASAATGRWASWSRNSPYTPALLRHLGTPGVRGACDVPRRVGCGERVDGKLAVRVFVADWRVLLGGRTAAARGGSDLANGPPSGAQTPATRSDDPLRPKPVTTGGSGSPPGSPDRGRGPASSVTPLPPDGARRGLRR